MRGKFHLEMSTRANDNQLETIFYKKILFCRIP